MTTVQTHELAEIEPVTVLACIYLDTFRVGSTGTIELITSLGESSQIPMQVGCQSSAWYAADVGMVKSQSHEQEGLFTVELVSVE